MSSPILNTTSAPSESSNAARHGARSPDHARAEGQLPDLFSQLFFTQLDDGSPEGDGEGIAAGRFLPDGGQLLQAGLPSDEALDLDPEMLARLAEWLPTAGEQMDVAPGEVADLREWLALALANAMPEKPGTDSAAAARAPGARLPDAIQPGQGAMAREIAWRAELALRGDQVAADEAGLAPGRQELSLPGQQSGAQSAAATAITNAQLQQLMRLAQSSAKGQGEQVSGITRASDNAATESMLQGVLSAGQNAALLAGADRGMAALPSLSLATPMHQPQWSEEVGNRIRWMVSNRIQSAELKINPPQLGPIEVRVSVNKDQMNVSFMSQHAMVRESLEEAIPRLREMLAGQGFTDVNVDVSQHSDTGKGDQESALRQANADEDNAGDSIRSQGRSIDSGVIDFYA